MLPVLFKIGSFQVHSYGVVLMIAFIICMAYAQKRGARMGISKTEVADVSIWLVVAGVLGARLLYIAQEYHSMSWSEVFSIQFAGLTSFGSIIGGLIALFIVAKRKKRPAVEYLDLFGPPMVLGQAIGRVGCLLNGCCLGGVCPTDVPWGVTVAGSTLHFHPAQIYESLMLLGSLGLIMLIERRSLRLGQVFWLSIFFLGICRFIYEFWRAGTVAQVDAHLASSTYWGGLPITQAQAVAGIMAVGGIIGYFLCGRRVTSGANPQPA